MNVDRSLTGSLKTVTANPYFSSPNLNVKVMSGSSSTISILALFNVIFDNVFQN